MILLLQNCTVFDGFAAELREGQTIVIENGVIREVSKTASFRGDGHRIDTGGRFVMPGLIDAHFHAYGLQMNPAQIDAVPPQLRGLHAKRILEATLQRGFTTVRDAAGGDHALATALRTGLIDGPRLFYAGLAISQTGGHGDLRDPGHFDACGCSGTGALAAIADGPDEVRKAVRDQLRTGAHQIKLFVSGGVLSPTDPIWMNQFSDEEIRAAVMEAATRRVYVMAHAHTNEAVLRCIGNGVRSVEHATMLEASGARAIAQNNAFAVPTLAIIDAVRQSGPALGLPAAMMRKTEEVGNLANLALEHLRQADAKIGFGTDLLGPLMDRQSSEFRLRREVCTPLEILRSVTSVNAELLQMSGQLGTIGPNALADILVVDGNPLEDITVLERHPAIRVIVRDGRIIRNELQ
jgi:imidazolonepropionase-like amidohydrolase